MVRTTSNACVQRLSALTGTLLAISWLAGPRPVTAGVVPASLNQVFLAGGQAQEISPPPSVAPGELVSTTTIKVFKEHEKFVLRAPVLVDVVGSGAVSDAKDLSFGNIAAGTKVNIYFIHGDVGDAASVQPIIGTAEFDQPVLGIMVSEATLSRADGALGSPSTSYPMTEARGLELDDGDWFEISGDRKSIRFNLNLVGSLDQIRVITLADDDDSASMNGGDGLGLTGGGGGMGDGTAGGPGRPPVGNDFPFAGDSSGSGAGPRQFPPTNSNSITLPDNPTDLMPPATPLPPKDSVPPDPTPNDGSPDNPPHDPPDPPSVPAPGSLLLLGLSAAGAMRRNRR